MNEPWAHFHAHSRYSIKDGMSDVGAMVDKAAATRNDSYASQGIRSDSANYRLQDPSLLAGEDEFGDGISLQILSVFPGFVLQQIQNCMAVRQIIPRDVDRTDRKSTFLCSVWRRGRRVHLCGERHRQPPTLGRIIVHSPVIHRYDTNRSVCRGHPLGQPARQCLPFNDRRCWRQSVVGAFQ